MSACLGPGIKCETVNGRIAGGARLPCCCRWSQGLRWVSTQRERVPFTAEPRPSTAAEIGFGIVRFTEVAGDRSRRGSVSTLLTVCRNHQQLCEYQRPFRSLAPPGLGSARQIALTNIQQCIHAAPMRGGHGQLGKIFNPVITVTGR